MKIGTKKIDKQNQSGIPITMNMFKAAFSKVSKNGNAAGIDGFTVKQFQSDLDINLYVVFNRMRAGSYFPRGVKQVEIPKDGGKKRKLGIPTVRDRVAQTVIKDLIEPNIDRIFHNSSYGCRPNKSAHQALKQVRENCWETAWVVDLDIKNFFDSIDHELLMKAVDVHIEDKWIKMYIRRWLTAPVVTRGGIIEKEGKGTPQGGVISPLLANLFLHYVIDKWMEKEFPTIKFVRYVDDVIVHCVSNKQAQYVLSRIRKRLNECKLNLNEEKTGIVYCKQAGRTEEYPNIAFDFLGHTFKPRLVAKRNTKEIFVNFGAGISTKSQSKFLAKLKVSMGKTKACEDLADVARMINPMIRGWLNYFGYIGRWSLGQVLYAISQRIVKWLRMKYKRLCGKVNKCVKLLEKVKRQNPGLFAWWSY